MWIDDQVLKLYTKKIHSEIFIPRENAVVLGSGNDESLEVHKPACDKNGIPVLRRYGGGGTVVLYPGCLVVSAGCWVKEQFQNSMYFDFLNRAVIESLKQALPDLPELSQAGISDIIHGGKKIAGTSLFRSRNYLLYQASVLVDLDFDLVESVLRHPSKEPDYRQGRRHSDFLTSLNAVVRRKISNHDLAGDVASVFNQVAASILGSHLIEPVEAQMPALKARLDRAQEHTGY